MKLDRIEAILRLLQRQEHVGEISVEGDGWRLQARKARAPYAPGAPFVPTEETPIPEAPDLSPYLAVRAGMVGIYRAPDAPLRPGDFVARGAAVGDIEAM